MKSATIATIAGLAAIATASSDVLSTASGVARIYSYCSDDVYIMNTPCDASVDKIYATLNSDNPSYEQKYTALEGGCGWSIVFGSESSLTNPNIMQYEYTWQGSGEDVWYDMSLVNSDGESLYDWEFVSSDTETCNPDDADYFTDATTTTGMQTSCSDTIDLTLYLCSTNASTTSSSSSSSSSSASSSASTSATTEESSSVYSTSYETTSTAVASTSTSSEESSTKQSTTFATSTSSADSGRWTVQDNVESSTSTTVAAATTTSDSTTTTTAANGNVVTEVEVAYVTEVATYTAYVEGRDAKATPAVHRRHTHGHPHGVRN